MKRNYTDGTTYEGEYKDGEWHGHGTWTHPDGRKYEGEFKDGQPNGQGIWTHTDGRKYEGEYKDGKRHGQGIWTHTDGSKYEGEYKDGKRHGQGTYTFTGGSIYEGEWKNDEQHGQGTYTHADGDKYEGEYKDGQEHGQGTYTHADGRKYEGEWKDGKYHGQGTWTFFDGQKWEGEFKDGEPHGQGTMTYPDGRKYEGIFRDGKEAHITSDKKPNLNHLKPMTEDIEKKGFVYIMTNPDMPGLLKVGMTKKVPTERVKDDDLFSTGIPSRFIVQYFALFDDMVKAERLAHRKLSKFRHAKEFFKIDVETAIQAIESTGIPFQARHSKPEYDRRIVELKAEQHRKQVADSLRQEKEEKAILVKLKRYFSPDTPINKFLLQEHIPNYALEHQEVSEDVKERISALNEDRQQRIKQAILQMRQELEQAKEVEVAKEKRIARKEVLTKVSDFIITLLIIFIFVMVGSSIILVANDLGNKEIPAPLVDLAPLAFFLSAGGTLILLIIRKSIRRNLDT